MLLLAGSAPAVAATGAQDRSLNAQDRKFLDSAAQGALFEVTGGRAADRLSNNSAVRAFGRRMVVDHGREYRDLSRLAGMLRVSLPRRPDADQRKTLELWSQLRNGPFSCAYAPGEVVDHMLDIQEYKEEVDKGRNPRVRHFAAQWLPVLRSHLHQAENVLQSLDRC